MCGSEYTNLAMLLYMASSDKEHPRLLFEELCTNFRPLWHPQKRPDRRKLATLKLSLGLDAIFTQTSSFLLIELNRDHAFSMSASVLPVLYMYIL